MKSSLTTCSVALAAALWVPLPAWSGPGGPGPGAGGVPSAGASAQHRGGRFERPPVAGGAEQPKVLGRTMGEWAAQWVSWIYAGPNGQNVLQDTNGEFCALNQPSSRVWFLGGTFGGPEVTRSCTVPRGRALFYPIIATAWLDCPGTPDETLSDAEVRDILANFAFGAATELSTTLNGVPVASLQVPIVRTQSPAFTSVLPNGNVVDFCPSPIPAGRSGRQIADGYWVMLPALPAGAHTLTLRGAVPGFENSVTYHLTVR